MYSQLGSRSVLGSITAVTEWETGIHPGQPLTKLNVYNLEAHIKVPLPGLLAQRHHCWFFSALACHVPILYVCCMQTLFKNCLLLTEKLAKHNSAVQLWFYRQAVCVCVPVCACAHVCPYSNIRQCHLLGWCIARNVIRVVFVSLGHLYYFRCDSVK